MLTASIENIDNTTWAGAIASPSNAQLEVRPYSFARPRGLFLAGELMLLAVALLQTAWGRHNLGALILIGSCALSFHMGVAILEPRPTIHKFNELGRFGLVLRVA
jgi:hypothetical protein